MAEIKASHRWTISIVTSELGPKDSKPQLSQDLQACNTHISAEEMCPATFGGR